MPTSAASLAETQQRNLLKQIALIGFVGTLSYTYLFLFVWKLKWVAAFDFVCLFAYLYFFYLSHTKKVIGNLLRYGALQFFIVHMAGICFVFLGRETGLQFYWLSLSMAVLLLTPLDRSINKYLTAALALFLFYILEFGLYDVTPLYQLEESQNKFLYFSTLTFSCLGVALISHHVTLVLRQSHATLHHYSVTDELTELGNRRHLFEHFKLIDLSNQNAQYAVYVMDIDHFKQINDTYGHSAGDAVLKKVADSIVQCFPTGTRICRVGGEEFCVILENSDRQETQRCAELVRHSIEQLYVYSKKQKIQCTISIGVAMGNHELSMSETMSMADKALYIAKQTGRNRVKFNEHA
jgi:diguanylate cyclase (GGDEF)-like protein